MTDSDAQLDLEALAEAFDEGGTWLLDLVAAVDHLRRGLRPGITVWEALEEATTEEADPDDGQIDWQAVQGPLRRWLLVMADRYNDGHHWPHPASRRSFPPVLLNLADLQM